ncbi:hypothetical protein [Streptomyces antimycoticus]|uniref:hypothetical protein n=1 Tax=Streptomyces antimycoticus TaxID=68175 RepID=UPI00117C05C1|nr:hypothetical protein [Streptomyces antimycoticus]
MTERGEGAGMQEVSAGPRERMGDCQTLAVNARVKIHATLAAAEMEPDEADELLCAVEAGAVAGAHCWVAELPGCAPGVHGTAYGDGWDGGVDRAIGVGLHRRQRLPAARARTRHQVTAGGRGDPPQPARGRGPSDRGA